MAIGIKRATIYRWIKLVEEKKESKEKVVVGLCKIIIAKYLLFVSISNDYKRNMILIA